MDVTNGIGSRSATRIRRLVGVALVALLVPAMIAGTGGATAPVFGTAIRVTGLPPFEPGINLGADGTIFVDTPGGWPGGHGSLARLKPGEAAFKKLTFTQPWNRLPGSGDTWVVVAPPGEGGTGNRVYFLDLWVGSNSLAVSENDGDGWAYGQAVTNIPTADRQWIARGKRDPLTGKDTLYLIYAQFAPPSWVMFARSTDGGLTWPYQRRIPDVIAGPTGFTGNMVTDGDYVGVVLEEGGNLRYLHSVDAGLNWTDSRINFFDGFAFGNIPSVAKDGNNVYVAWIDKVKFEVHVAFSRDRGTTWTDFQTIPGEPKPKQITVSTPGNSNMFAWVAARNGKVGVAWYSTARIGTTSYGPDAQTAGKWQLHYAQATDAGDPLLFDGPFCIAGCGTKPIKDGLICTGGLGCDPALGGPGGRELGDFLSMTMDPAGLSIIAFGDVAGGGGGGAGGATKVIRQIS